VSIIISSIHENIHCGRSSEEQKVDIKINRKASRSRSETKVNRQIVVWYCKISVPQAIPINQEIKRIAKGCDGDVNADMVLAGLKVRLECWIKRVKQRYRIQASPWL